MDKRLVTSATLREIYKFPEIAGLMWGYIANSFDDGTWEGEYMQREGGYYPSGPFSVADRWALGDDQSILNAFDNAFSYRYEFEGTRDIEPKVWRRLYKMVLGRTLNFY